MLGLVGPTIGVATNVSKVVGRLQSLRAVSEDCELLWQTLESVEAAFQLAACLQKRQRSLHVFHGAVRLTQGTIEACERVLASDEDEAVPSSRDGWLKWLGRQKQGMRRQDALPKLTERLGLCMKSLQLAFATMNTLQAPLWASPHGLRQPFTLLGEAVEQARSVVQEFEMGRRRGLLLCLGRLYTCSSSAVEARAGDKEWNAGDLYSLSLELHDDCTYHLVLRPAPQTAGLDSEDCDGDAGCKQAVVHIRVGERVLWLSRRLPSDVPGLQPRDEVLRLSRRWLGDVPGLQPHGRGEAFAADQPVYVLEPEAAEGAAEGYALLFEVPTLCPDDGEEDGCGRRPLSAEAFEAVLAMLLLKAGLEDGKHCLAHVCDLDSRAGLERFQASLQELVGPYEPAAAAGGSAATAGDGGMALLSHRMRQAVLDP